MGARANVRDLRRWARLADDRHVDDHRNALSRVASLPMEYWVLRRVPEADTSPASTAPTTTSPRGSIRSSTRAILGSYGAHCSTRTRRASTSTWPATRADEGDPADSIRSQTALAQLVVDLDELSLQLRPGPPRGVGLPPQTRFSCPVVSLSGFLLRFRARPNLIPASEGSRARISTCATSMICVPSLSVTMLLPANIAMTTAP